MSYLEIGRSSCWKCLGQGKVKNITNASLTISRFDNANRALRPAPNQTIPAGFYPTLDILMTKLFKTVSEQGEHNIIPVSWKVDPVSDKLEVSFTGQAPEVQPSILFKSDDLSNTLAVTDAICGTVGSQRQKGLAALGTIPVDLHGDRHTMCIYCDLVQNEILGDSQAALLRVIPLQQNVASTASTCYRTFDKMQWKRLIKSNFQSITISLCDVSGQLMLFLSIDRTKITLYFRQRKKNIVIR